MPTSRTTPPSRQTQRYLREDLKVYTSTLSSVSSDSEDGESESRGGTRIQPIRRRKMPDKAISREVRTSLAASEDGVYAASRRIQHYQNQTRGLNRQPSSSTPEESGDIFVTTMDEDDQQMFIALFYWRRKVIETHFSAWKWVVFTLRRSAKQIHRHRIHSYVNQRNSTGQPRRNLILKRHTDRLSAGEFENNQKAVEYEKTSRSVNQRLNDVDAQELMLTEKRAPSLTTSNSCEKRRQFRAELRLVYSCFKEWKLSIKNSRQRRVHRLIQASNFHRAQQLKSSFNVWLCNSKVHKLERNRLNIADQFHKSRTKSATLSSWRRFCQVEREIFRRQNVNAALQKRFCFQHWYKCIFQTRTCREFATTRCHNRLLRTFSFFRDGVLLVRRCRLQWDSAVSHCQTNRKLKSFRSWRKVVFEDPSYLLSNNYEQRISLSKGLTKWRKFKNQRQMQARNILLAGFFRSRASLMRAFRGWNHFFDWKHQRKLFYNHGQRHHERKLKLEGIESFRAAAYENRMKQVQNKRATDWHQRKVFIKMFVKWVLTTQKCRRIRSFQTAVKFRRLDCVFRSWSDQILVSKSYKAKQLTISSQWNHCLLRAFMTKWATQKRVNSSLTSIQLRYRTRSIADHFCAWRTWRNRNISLKSVIERQCTRRQAGLLQQIVSKWIGVTLRKRCFKRLVKLFRKKRARQHVKSIFGLWKVQSYVCIATRKRDGDRIHLILIEWRQACQRSKAKRVAIAVATQYYLDRRYVVAVKQWLSFTDRRLRKRDTEHRALSHYFQRILMNSLQRWNIAARNLRRHAKLLRKRQQLRDKQCLSRCMHDWISVVHQRNQRTEQKGTALRLYAQNLQRRIFCAWQTSLEARRLLHGKKGLAAVTYTSNLQVNVLRGWHFVVRKSIQRKIQLSLMRLAGEKRRLYFCVTRWFNFRCERRRRRQLHETAVKFCNENLLYLIMYHWQNVWFEASVIRRREAKVASQINSLRLQRAVSQWQANYHKSSTFVNQKIQAVQFCGKKTMAKRFTAWKCYHNTIQHKLSKWKLVRRLRHKRLLSRMYRRWHHYYKVRISVRQQRHEAIQHQTTSLLRLAFQTWRKYRSKRTQQFLAYFHRRRFVLQKMWTIWVAHNAYVTKLRQNILMSIEVRRNNMFRTTFCRWKAFISHRIERQIQLYRSEDHHVQWLFKWTVGHWKRQTQFHQAVVQAALLGHVNWVRRVWRRWNDYTAANRKQKCKWVMAEQTYLQNRRKSPFTGWKMLTKCSVQGRKEKSDVFYRISCLKMVWARWYRVVSWRRCSATIECRRLDYARVAAMQSWRTYTVFHVEKKAKMIIAHTFRHQKLRVNTWRSWLLYMAQCSEKQKQLKWALSYYSVMVLLRQSLSSWKRLVDIQQAHRVNDELAVSFNTHRLVLQGFCKWRTFIELKKQQMEKSDENLHKFKMLLLSRTVQTWRNQSTVWHQHRQSETIATQFYSRKRFVFGLKKLLNWRKEQKITRELTIQAKHFRSTKLTLRYFQCWQRYHQWRAKYANVICVFKQHQKGDIFTRWKIYWQKQQLIAEKRLKARVFHCVHVEQTMLKAWVAFVRAGMRKKLVKAFYTVKVYRMIFSFWKRRVHVLRQMRKILLYQESFRIQTHFDAWKHDFRTRKQTNERLRKAMKLRDSRCKMGVWQQWNTWVSIQQQEIETIKLAAWFQQQFCFRKNFAIWRIRAAYWNHKRTLSTQAIHTYQRSLVYQSFQSLMAWRQTKVRLSQLQKDLTALLIEKRKLRVISKFLVLCTDRKRKQNLIRCAFRHWQFSHLLKYWNCVMLWFRVAQHRKQQAIKAAVFARTKLLRRSLCAIRVHIVHSKQVKEKVDAFRCRFFRSVSDDCFYQWRAFLSFKQKLRVLRRKIWHSERRQWIQRWHIITIEQVRHRAKLQQIVTKRRQRELVLWFNHWESVCTDLWLDRELVLHHQRHGQTRRLQRIGFKVLQAQLPARHERLKCKSFFLQHHREWLVQILHHWRQSTSTCDVRTAVAIEEGFHLPAGVGSVDKSTMRNRSFNILNNNNSASAPYLSPRTVANMASSGQLSESVSEGFLVGVDGRVYQADPEVVALVQERTRGIKLPKAVAPRRTLPVHGDAGDD